MAGVVTHSFDKFLVESLGHRVCIIVKVPIPCEVTIHLTSDFLLYSFACVYCLLMSTFSLLMNLFCCKYFSHFAHLPPQAPLSCTCVCYVEL